MRFSPKQTSGLYLGSHYPIGLRTSAYSVPAVSHHPSSNNHHLRPSSLVTHVRLVEIACDAVLCVALCMFVGSFHACKWQLGLISGLNEGR